MQSRPSPAAGVRGTVDGCFADMRYRVLIDGLLAGLWIDSRDNVLIHGFLVPEKFASGAIEHLNDAELTNRHERFAGRAINRQIDEDTFVRIIEIPGVGRQMLEVPLQLAGLGIEGKGGIRVKRIVLQAVFFGSQSVHFGDPGVGLADPEEKRFRLGVVAAGVPDRRAMTFFEWHPAIRTL